MLGWDMAILRQIGFQRRSDWIANLDAIRFHGRIRVMPNYPVFWEDVTRFDLGLNARITQPFLNQSAGRPYFTLSRRMRNKVKTRVIDTTLITDNAICQQALPFCATTTLKPPSTYNDNIT